MSPHDFQRVIPDILDASARHDPFAMHARVVGISAIRLGEK